MQNNDFEFSIEGHVQKAIDADFCRIAANHITHPKIGIEAIPKMVDTMNATFIHYNVRYTCISATVSEDGTFLMLKVSEIPTATFTLKVCG